MEETQRLMDDCFLRPIASARSTNVTKQAAEPSKPALKTELQVLRLSEESQQMTMETLRAIHGPDFKLDLDLTHYKDRGGHMRKAYWEDRGTLLVQSVENFSAAKIPGNGNINEERLRRYALKKLESYGFAEKHCEEAYTHCKNNVDDALLLLFKIYMGLNDGAQRETQRKTQSPFVNYNTQDMREDEKEALDSIYEKVFEEKEKNKVWSLKFKLDHLLEFSPSEQRRAREREREQAKAKTQGSAKKKERERCRNFDKTGSCRFGKNCRFAHIVPEAVETKKSALENNENRNCFFLEIRFPPDSLYPHEPPYVFLKTTCPDIPPQILLHISRKLYREACDICHEGMPCVYSISETLQVDESLAKFLDQDSIPFPHPNKSLFYDKSKDEKLKKDAKAEVLPSHYERGQTSHDGNYERSGSQIEREDKKLVQWFLDIQSDSRYRKMLNARKKLPAFDKMLDVLEMIKKSQVVVISGETGCGKSTQIPQFILDDWLYEASKLSDSRPVPHVEIICTQPRRLSAIGVAERVAEERTDRIGQTIGYQIRLENKVSPSTRLTFCTTGILLRRLASDPLLESVTHVIVDEVHERSEESDFLLMILRRLLKKRSKLKVILMSATLNAKLFSDYFIDAPVLEIPGRTFPVEQLFLENILDLCDYVLECDSPFCRKIQKKDEEKLLQELEYADIKADNVAPPAKMKDEQLNLAATFARYSNYHKKTCKTIYLMDPMKINTDLIESVLKFIVDGDHSWPRSGTILIFLPGLQEIQAVHEALCDTVMFSPRTAKFVLVPLHSSLSSEEQAAVFRPPPKGKRKIVLSTNIAETSITIDDCVFVIDCGMMKEKSFDSNRNMESLDLVWVSRANALQRKGRAGRVMPGVCIHLFTEHRFQHMLSQPVPEIQRVPLEQLILRIKTLESFDDSNIFEVIGEVIEPPTEFNIESAIIRLQDVGAIDADHSLTPLGHHLSALPVDVRIGKLMLFGAIFQCLDSVLTIAACLSHKSPFVSPFNKRTEAEKRKREFAVCNSDHLTCLMAYKKWLDVSTRNFFASRNYAEEHFLSLKTLQTISEVKYQFLELLVSIGFVPINVPRKRKNAEDNILSLTGYDLNVNGNNNRLLISLLCASLYPNIVKILTPERSYIQTAAGAMPKPTQAKDLRFKTREDGFVALHPSSVNADVANFQSSFLVYQEKVKTSRIFIRECSLINVISLVLFAGSDLKIELHNGDFVFLLENGWIILKAHNHETAEMIHCLRVELQKLLQLKISDPCLNLLNHENGRKIIQTIVLLVSKNN